jgi:putative colanic acid biosysnthesis UDP-glucose lipid carrier transferase
LLKHTDQTLQAIASTHTLGNNPGQRARGVLAFTLEAADAGLLSTRAYVPYDLPTPVSRYSAMFKWLFDFTGALTALLLLGIPMAVIALVVKLNDGGPIFYLQRRLGARGREFSMIKFRTMVRDAEPAGPVFAQVADPRCTRVGGWLRVSGLDELPQLFNVLRGEMSLVGPRPERAEMLARIERDIPGYAQRLQVQAGITGLAQVHGFRGQTSFCKRLEYDLQYARNWSPLLDVRIILATMACGFRAMMR